MKYSRIISSVISQFAFYNMFCAHITGIPVANSFVYFLLSSLNSQLTISRLEQGAPFKTQPNNNHVLRHKNEIGNRPVLV
jgi:hypothetical protein